jgi:YVTN family beta-propeller protein
MKVLFSKKNIILFSGVLITFLVVFSLIRFKANAAPNIYYFNNAVNTSPATLGNYWTDYAATQQALQLPNLAEDEVTVLAGATYAGNATFNGTAVNEGTVTGTAILNDQSVNEGVISGESTFNDNSVNEGTVSGDAIFVGDLSENTGTLEATIIRRYYSNIVTTRHFTNYGSEIYIQADGAVVDLRGATFDNTGVYFERYNDGYFLSGVSLSHANVVGNILSLVFNNPFAELGDNGSVEYGGDYSTFTVTVDGDPVTINAGSSNSISKIVLNQSVGVNSEVRLSYEIDSSPITVNENSINANPIDNVLVPVGTPTTTISVGADPVYSTLVGTKLYVSNKAGNSVTVINTLTDTVITTISVGSGPEMSVLVDNKLYVNNINSNTVSVINTLADTVSSTISVGNGPYFSVVAGRKIYVSNTGTNTVSVINTDSDTVTATITVGGAPWFAAVVGTKIYVPIRTANVVSVINSVTDTVVASINVSAPSSAGTKAVAIGSRVYVGRRGSMAVINSVTDTVIATPWLGDVGQFSEPMPYFSVTIDDKLYVMQRGFTDVPIIDSDSNTVTDSIITNSTFYSASVIEKIIYANDPNLHRVVIIDSASNQVIGLIPTGNEPFYSTPVGNKIYVSNFGSDTVTVFDSTKIASLFPYLTSFTSTSLNGTYYVDDQINITANFGSTLEAGSNMTVRLSNGASVVLNNVNGSSLSGQYTIAGGGEYSPDLSVASITSASVTDIGQHTRTTYQLPSSQGSPSLFIAENSFITRDIGDSKNIVIDRAFSVPVGVNPYQISPAITVDGNQYIYVANQGDATVSVIRLSDHAVVDTISVGLEAYAVTTATVSGITYVYIVNTGGDSVSVINTNTNEVTATIPVGVKPYYAATLGSNVYVTNSQSNSVSVINTLTNTVTATIPVGLYPRGIKALGSSIYVANYGNENYSGGNTISVINSANNTVTDTIILPAGSTGPRGLNVLGSNVYVANFRSDNVSVINSATNTVSHTIAVGDGPRGILGLGSKVFVENFNSGTLSIINTASHSVMDTVRVGHSPTGMGLNDTDLYISLFQDNKVSILDTTTNTLYRTDPNPPGGGGGGSIVINQPPVVESTNTSDNENEGESENDTEDPNVSDEPVLETVEENFPSFSIELARRLAGRFLLAVDDRGRIWYVDPESLQRYEVNYRTVLNLFIKTSLGITNKNLLKVPLTEQKFLSNQLGNKLKGKILLQTEEHGKTWYVDFTGVRHSITIDNIIEVAKKFILGISNDYLNKIQKAQ